MAAMAASLIMNDIGLLLKAQARRSTFATVCASHFPPRAVGRRFRLDRLRDDLTLALGVGAPVGLNTVGAQKRVLQVVRQDDPISAELAQRDGALDAPKALLRPVPRLRRRLLEQIARQTGPAHDRLGENMRALGGAFEDLDQLVAVGRGRHERNEVRSKFWRPVTPERLEDGYGVDPPHAGGTLAQRNAALDPSCEQPDDLFSVRRPASLDADEHAWTPLPQAVESCESASNATPFRFEA
jgi:hypothetical protein